jgi:hypothetical protein
MTQDTRANRMVWTAWLGGISAGAANINKSGFAALRA